MKNTYLELPARGFPRQGLEIVLYISFVTWPN